MLKRGYQKAISGLNNLSPKKRNNTKRLRNRYSNADRLSENYMKEQGLLKDHLIVILIKLED